MAPQVIQWLKRHLEESDNANCPENLLEGLMELVSVMGLVVTKSNANYFMPLLGSERAKVENSLRCMFIDRLEEDWIKDDDDRELGKLIQFPKRDK